MVTPCLMLLLSTRYSILGLARKEKQDTGFDFPFFLLENAGELPFFNSKRGYNPYKHTKLKKRTKTENSTVYFTKGCTDHR
jgi:hypothetical protein